MATYILFVTVALSTESINCEEGFNLVEGKES